MKQLFLKIIVLPSLMGVFFAGCDLGQTSTPEGLIPDSLLVEVLADFFIAEGAMIQLEYIHRKQPDSGAPLYKAIFEKHGINRDQVISSIDYYSQDDEKIDRIYDLVILELSRRQSSIGETKEE
jgi:hypothetical protein